MDVQIEASWKSVLQEEFQKPYFLSLAQFVKEEYQKGPVFPAGKNIFQAFEACPFPAVKVVILGQDPYHGEGQAHGLSFSVMDGVPKPPSLVNIFQEIQNDFGTIPPSSGNLMRWAQQGVLLLNTVLTVKAHLPQSHRGKGWETFTDAAIAAINTRQQPTVFLLWGAPAQTKATLIDENKHLVLRAPHPSPLSAYRGFLGCKHFSKTNAFLESHSLGGIKW